MATVLDDLIVNLIGRDMGFGRMVKAAASDMSVFDRAASSALGTLSSFGVVLNGLDLGKRMVGLASAAEKMQISFSVMLGSAAKATKLVGDLQKYAAETPLTQTDLQSATKTLLQFGTEAEDLMPVLKSLGDVTGGDNQSFQGMALAFGQMSATGRLMGQELNQMINAGFNPLKEISRTTGKGMAQLKQEMEAGKITVDKVTRAFKTATQEGGPFAGMLKQMSESMEGLQSTFSDDVDAFFREVGQDVVKNLELKEGLKELSRTVQSLTKEWKALTPEMKAWVTTAGVTVAAGFALSASLGLVRFALSGVTSLVVAGLGPLGTYVKTVGALTAAVSLLKVGLVGLGAVLAFKLADGALGETKEWQDLQRSMTVGEVLNNRRVAAREGRFNDRMGSIAGIPTEVGRKSALEEQQRLIEAELAAETKRAEGLQTQLRRDRGMLVKSWWSAQGGAGPKEFFNDLLGWNPEAAATRQNIAEAGKSVEALQRNLDGVRDRLKEINDQSKILFLASQQVKAFNDEVGRGITARSPLRDKLAAMEQTPGVTKDQVDGMRRRVQLSEDLAERQKVSLSLIEREADLRKQMAAAGVDGPRGDLLSMLMENKKLDAGDRHSIKKQIDMLDKLDAIKLNEQYASPAEKAAKEIDRLNAAFATGELSVTAYDRALMEAVKGMGDLHAATQQLQGVGVGSAEYWANVAAYQRQQDSPRVMQDRLNDLTKTGGPLDPNTGQRPRETGAERLLREIRDELKKDKGDKAEALRPANLATSLGVGLPRYKAGA